MRTPRIFCAEEKVLIQRAFLRAIKEFLTREALRASLKKDPLLAPPTAPFSPVPGEN